MANSASAIEGATTARLVFFCSAIVHYEARVNKLRLITTVGLESFSLGILKRAIVFEETDLVTPWIGHGKVFDSRSCQRADVDFVRGQIAAESR